MLIVIDVIYISEQILNKRKSAHAHIGLDFFSEKRNNVTFEITPQHLTLFAPDCYEKLKTFSQMNPPIRSKDHHDRLWDAVKESLVSTIGSDHAPHLKKDKV